jgi:CheY-like chemotaxis protein
MRRGTEEPAQRLAEPLREVSASTILMFGWDPILLRTRQMLLSRHGYVVWTAMHLGEVERLLSEKPIQLLILCYSVDEYECARALELARSRPPIQSLLLISGDYASGVPRPDGVLNIFEGPAKLVSTVAKLLKPDARSLYEHY